MGKKRRKMLRPKFATKYAAMREAVGMIRKSKSGPSPSPVEKPDWWPTIKEEKENKVEESILPPEPAKAKPKTKKVAKKPSDSKKTKRTKTTTVKKDK